MSRLITKIQNVIERSRYALLAGAMLSTVALPQWSAESAILFGRSDDIISARSDDGTIVLAEATEPKGKANQKGQKKGEGQTKTPQKKETKQAPKQIPKSETGGAPKGKGEAKGAPKGEPKGQGEAKGTPKGEPKGKGEAKGTPKSEPKGKGEAKGTPKSEPKGKGEAKGTPKGEPKGKGEAKGTPKGEPKGKGEAKGTPKGEPKGKGEAKGAPKGLPKGSVAKGPEGGNVDRVRTERRERVEGNRTIIEEPGSRTIIREEGRVIIRHDDTVRFRRWGEARVERRGGEVITIVRRPGGVEIITVMDANGRLLRRIHRGPDRREIILIDNTPRPGVSGFYLTLAPPVITIPRERYIVNVAAAPPALLAETLVAPPLVPIERAYSLDEIRYNVALRDRMRRIDIDTINFESGSWEVSPDQIATLQAIAEVIKQAIASNPSEVFMIEGHTDAVGSDVDNLSLSDRRAESVADILTSDYDIPPENLVSQGYGEQFLKVPTQGPLRENRRVTVRRITPLLTGAK